MTPSSDRDSLSREEAAHLIQEMNQLREERLEIKKIETLFKLITENVADMIAVIDPTGRRLWNNAAYLSTLGYAPSSLEGTDSMAEVHPDDLPMLQSIFEESIRTGMGRKAEYRMRHARGHWVELESVARVVTNDQGGVECLVLVSRDISARRKTEAELIKAKKNEAVNSLASGVGHEFESIVNNLVEQLRLMRSDLARGYDIMRDLEQVEAAVSQAQLVVRRLINMGDTEEPERQVLILGPWLKGIAEAAVANSMARCDVAVSPACPTIQVEQQAFTQAVKNILQNSVEATTSRSVIRVTADPVSFNLVSSSRPPQLEPGNYVCIEIRDQGRGIDLDNISRVFEPYFSTKEKAQGMGLTTALSVLARHKGTILLDSKPRVGTTVRIYVPAQGAVAHERASEPIFKAIVQHRPRVLFMDDEDLVRNFVGTMLNQIGYDATVVSDGAEAVKLYQDAMARGKKFDAVIMDLLVPGGTGGTSAIHSLRQIDANVVAIASSGYMDQPAMVDPTPFGFSAVIAKPFNRERLREVLGSVLK